MDFGSSIDSYPSKNSLEEITEFEEPIKEMEQRSSPYQDGGYLSYIDGRPVPRHNDLWEDLSLGNLSDIPLEEEERVYLDFFLYLFRERRECFEEKKERYNKQTERTKEEYSFEHFYEDKCISCRRWRYHGEAAWYRGYKDFEDLRVSAKRITFVVPLFICNRDFPNDASDYCESPMRFFEHLQYILAHPKNSNNWCGFHFGPKKLEYFLKEIMEGRYHQNNANKVKEVLLLAAQELQSHPNILLFLTKAKENLWKTCAYNRTYLSILPPEVMEHNVAKYLSPSNCLLKYLSS